MIAESFEVLIEVENPDSGILRRGGDGEIGEGIAMGAMGAAGSQFAHQRHDCTHHLLGRAVGTAPRRPGARLQGLKASLAVAGQSL